MGNYKYKIMAMALLVVAISALVFFLLHPLVVISVAAMCYLGYVIKNRGKGRYN
jgi:hypothetical protein